MSALDRFLRYRPTAETAERQISEATAVNPSAGLSATPGRQAAEPSKICRALPPPAESDETEDQSNVVSLCQSAVSANEDEGERIAIIQYDGGIPAAWASAFHQLCKSHRPEWLTVDQWQRYIDAAGALVANWSSAIERVGWPIPEVLGVNPKSPGSAWDMACLLPALVGVRVGALDKHTITIVFNDGGKRQLARNAGKWVYL